VRLRRRDGNGATAPSCAAGPPAVCEQEGCLVSCLSSSRQGDAEPEDGPIPCEGEYLAVRAEDGRPEQRVRSTRPFRDQPVRPVEN